MKNSTIDRIFLVTVAIGFLLVSVAGFAEHKDKPTTKSAMPYLVSEAMHPAPPKQPNFGPKYGSITFQDTDTSDDIGGVLTMQRAINSDGERVDEIAEGITTYMIHWGLEVGEVGVEDDKGAGDHGGDCRGFRDTGHVVMREVEDLDDNDTISWDIPKGTKLPDGAVYFVGHTLYGEIHNLGKCTQAPIENVVKPL